MRRRRSPQVDPRNAPLLARIQALKADHPFWGYRRLWTHMRFADGLAVNKTRILRLLREHDLVVKPNLRLKATRTPQRSKPRPTASNQWWGILIACLLIVLGLVAPSILRPVYRTWMFIGHVLG